MSVESVARWLTVEDDPWDEFAKKAGIFVGERRGLTRGYALCVPGAGCEIWLPGDLNSAARARHLKELLCNLYLQAFGRCATIGQLRLMVGTLTALPDDNEMVAS
jgi:hypothetical protein